MRRPRITVRKLMITVAVVGIMLGIMIERQDRFRKIAAHHRAESHRLLGHLHPFATDESDEAIWRCLEWLKPMNLKYERAARYPWLPVWPDPPKPPEPERCKHEYSEQFKRT